MKLGGRKKFPAIWRTVRHNRHKSLFGSWKEKSKLVSSQFVFVVNLFFKFWKDILLRHSTWISISWRELINFYFFIFTFKTSDLNIQTLRRAYYFFKHGPIPASFSLIFVPFTPQINYKLKKSVDVVYGNRTRGHRMVGADETTELWWPP